VYQVMWCESIRLLQTFVVESIQISLIANTLPKSHGTLTKSEGRLSTVDLLIKINCCVTKVNNIFYKNF
jgi:hypothetical protein